MAILANFTLGDVARVLKKYYSFIGPGLIVSVSYMDPGNYSTSVSSGAMYEYKLCFIILLSNIFAIILQSLCVKLGTITGLDLAEMCRLNLPVHWNLLLYIFSELAIIATDLAEVIGTAISLQILFGIPLVFGVLITILDVLVVLVAYHKDGTLKQTRTFEILVSILVLATCTCFILELFKCNFEPGSFGAIVKGFLPVYPEIIKEKNALFLSCGIVGSTVMPHSLFLGSALVQPRLKDYDIKHGLFNETDIEPEDGPSDVDTLVHESNNILSATFNKIKSISDGSNLTKKYRPSYQAIKYCLNYSYLELFFSLFFIAVFVNSAILIVAGSTLFGKPDAEDADLLSIYRMLSTYISPAAGLIFALSMLFSGQSAGIVCTMAGQIISEGFIDWSLKPWIRRVVTRTLAILPVLLVILVLGNDGVSTIINSSQVVLSFILPIITAPLIYFTCKKEYMTIYCPDDNTGARVEENTPLLNGSQAVNQVSFENGLFLRVTSILTWVFITFLNFYLIYLFANGIDI